jgi:hypothetical protein
MPTTGYGNIQFSFAVERSGSGPSTDYIYYTTDGTNFVPTCVADMVDSCIYTTSATWVVHSFNFVSVPATGNNANFAVKISYGSAWAGAGNNRFDNVVLKGDPWATSSVASIENAAPVYALSPNPATNNLNIDGTVEGGKSVVITNMLGQTIYSATEASKHISVNTSNFNSGVYVLTIHESISGELSTMKFIKQ